jgi:hypothetical protein
VNVLAGESAERGRTPVLIIDEATSSTTGTPRQLRPARPSFAIRETELHAGHACRELL